MKRSLSMSQVVSHPSTLAVFSGLLGALIGFLLNLASGGKTSQLLWHTPLYRLKTPAHQIAMVLSALAEGLDPSAAERSSATVRRPSRPG